MQRFLLPSLLTLSLFSGCGTQTSTTTQPTTTPDVFNSFGIGIGDASSFKFQSYSSQPTYISLDDLVLNTSLASNNYYKENIYNYDAQAFSTLQTYLSKSKFFTIWVTKGWSEEWYDIDAITNLIKSGKIPVFVYWYFGDDLVYAMPTQQELDEYAQDVARFSSLLSEFHTTKLIILEPEFNEDLVLEHLNEFSSVISNAIDTIKAKNKDALLSLCMTDAGNRSVTQTYESCGYENCALGDKEAWSLTKPIYDALLNKLDFISFQEMVGQFSRDPSNENETKQPVAKSYSDEEIGIDYLPQRIENFSAYLSQTYHKPVFLPYITIATASWQDSNEDGIIQEDEVIKDGWEDKADYVYKNLNKTKLQNNNLFGYSIMTLFDQSDHDIEGYQYFMNNEYHLGIIKSSAPDGSRDGIYGDIEFKKEILDSLFLK